jgi:LPXTG-site transpeptidase (sortase) family protein
MIDDTVRRPATRIRPGGGVAVAVILMAAVLTACGSLTPAGSAPPLPSAPVATESGAASAPSTSANGDAAQVPPATVELDGASPAQVALADVTDDGFLAVPEDISKLGWWIGSSPMGASRGTTLIAGHVDSAVAGLGVFAKLKEMGEGDQITVVDGLGNPWRFEVTDTQQVTKSQLPAELFDTAGDRRLALITCGGPFDERLRSYEDNLIVWAEPV